VGVCWGLFVLQPKVASKRWPDKACDGANF
jgi:hypothetical protein